MKNLKILLSLAIVHLLPIPAISQCYFHELYGLHPNNDHDFGTALVQKSNGNIIVIGNTGVIPSIGLFLVAPDQCGDTLFQRGWDFSIGADDGYSIVEAENNNCVIVGAYYDSIEGKANSLMCKVSDNGGLIWFKGFNMGISDIAESVVKTSEGDFVFGGYYNRTTPDARVYLAKTDSSGNLIWTYDYGDTLALFQFLENLDKTLDGGYVLSGRVEYYISSVHYRDFFLIKTDSAGIEQWKKRYIKPLSQSLGYGISTQDSGYCIVGTTVYPDQTTKAYIVKTNIIGDTLWTMEYGVAGQSESFTVIRQLENGSYILGGGGSYPNNGFYAWILKINDQGGIIWQRQYSYYGGETQDYLEDLIITREGDIVATGYVLPVGVGTIAGSDMFILKTDSCGYVENDSINAAFTYIQDTLNKTIIWTNQSTEYCTALWYFGDGDSTYQHNPVHTYNDTGTYIITLIVQAGNSLDTVQQQLTITEPIGISVANHQSYMLKIFPNPATETLHIYILASPYSLQSLLLSDLSGKTILQTHETTIPLKSIAKGLYFVSVHLTNGESVVRKVVVE